MKNRKPIHILLIVIFSLLFLIPIWSVKYIPLQDWPVFMGISYIISHFSHFHSYFAVKPIPPPYSTGFLLLAGLMRIFPPLVAGKILLSIYIITFFASFYYFLRILNPEGLYLYFFAPLLVFNYFFGKGNINFILSLSIFLFVLPTVFRMIGDYRRQSILFTLFLSGFLYFTHLFTYMIFLLILLIVVIVRKKGSIHLVVSIIPLFFFIGYFLVNRAPVNLSFYHYLLPKLLSFRDTFGTWTPYFDVAILFIPLLFFLFVIFQGWRKARKEWKISFYILLILFIFSPVGIYTLSKPDQHILVFIFFTLVLFAKVPKSSKFLHFFLVFSILLSLVNLVKKESVFIALQSRIQKCISAISMVPQDKAVVGLGTKDYYVGVINPFVHILGYSIPLDENINIPSYEWNFPITNTVWFKWAKMDDGLIVNTTEILAQYDYFFVMEDGKNFENQLKMFADLVYANENVKLFEKK